MSNERAILTLRVCTVSHLSHVLLSCIIRRQHNSLDAIHKLGLTSRVLHAGARGPTALPYTHGPNETCPASYTANYRGGTFGVPPADLQVTGLSSDYIVR